MNNAAFLYYQSNFDLIKEICSPLGKHLGIENFGYLKVFKNSKYYYLSNDIELTKEYLFNVESSNIFCKELIFNTNYDKNDKKIHYILWPEKPENYSMEIYLKHHYWNGFTVLAINEQDIEMWWFASKKENHNIQLFYKRNIDTLLSYINFFRSKTEHISSNVYKNSANLLACYKKGFDFQFHDSVDTNYREVKHIEAFLKELYPKGIYIKSRNGIIKLTHTEIKCMKLLAMCNTAKEIAKKLNISDRTVQNHFDHIRKKSGYTLKSDLVKNFKDQIENILS